MVRWYIKIRNCLGFNHEHIIDVTPIEVVIKGKDEEKKEVSKRDNTPPKKEENPFDKNKFYTTAYECRSTNRKLLATFTGEHVYCLENPPDTLPEVTDIHEITEGDDLDWLTYHREEQQQLGQYFLEKADGYSTLWTTVFTIYTGLLVLFGFMVSAGSLNEVEWPKSIVFLFPILAWLAGIFFFFRIFNPTIEKMTPNSPAEIRELFCKSNVEKAKNYRNGLTCFSIGILLVACALFVGIFGHPLLTSQEKTSFLSSRMSLWRRYKKFPSA